MNSKYDVWPGLDVGKTTSHRICGFNLFGKRVYDHELPQDEAAQREAITAMQGERGRGLMVVDQPNTIGVLPVAVFRGCGADNAYLPGLAMCRAIARYSSAPDFP